MQNYNYSRDKHRSHMPERTSVKTPDFIDFYSDQDKGTLNPDWVANKAEEWADCFLKDRPPLTSAQIRRFYGDVLGLQERSRSQDFQIILPQVKMLKSKAAYAANPKKAGHIPASFKEFLHKMVDNVNNQKDLQSFKLIFESVVGYFYGRGAK